MIIRIWHGWTTRENADAYEHLLDRHVLPAIIERGIVGLHGVDLIRRDGGSDGDHDEVEFVTIMNFEDQAAVDEFAGPDPDVAVVPDEARQLLTRFDDRSTHYRLTSRQLAPYEVAVREAHEQAAAAEVDDAEEE